MALLSTSRSTSGVYSRRRIHVTQEYKYINVCCVYSFHYHEARESENRIDAYIRQEVAGFFFQTGMSFKLFTRHAKRKGQIEIGNLISDEE